MTNFIDSIERYNVVNQFYPQSHLLVSSALDLPEPVNGVIDLPPNVSYRISGIVDLAGARLRSSEPVAIYGASPEIDRIKSTGLDPNLPLIEATHTVALNYIGLDAKLILDFDASGNPDAAIDWGYVNFYNATTGVGTIKDYPNAIMFTMGFLNAGGLVFDGTIGTISITTSIFTPNASQTCVTLKDTLTITRRVRFLYSAFIAFPTTTGLVVEEGCTIPNSNLIIDSCNFSGGGTYISGVDHLADISEWHSNVGVPNSTTAAIYSMSDNATATAIAQVGTFYKVAGTTVAGSSVQRFSVSTSNRATHTGVKSSFFNVTGHASFTSGNNNIIAFRIAVNGVTLADSTTKSTANGTRNENTPIVGVVYLNEDDYVELFVANLTATNPVTVTDMLLRIVKQES